MLKFLYKIISGKSMKSFINVDGHEYGYMGWLFVETIYNVFGDCGKGYSG